jgi:hypothetical protein
MSGFCQQATYALRQIASYWITSSASKRNLSGTVSPNAFAVLRLIANVNLSACSTGRSPGLAPRRIFATCLPVILKAILYVDRV